ncbi:MAG: hypothetical protein ABI415_06790 [Flavitalea sp.]
MHSTRSDIEHVMAIHNEDPFTAHLEIETFTWEVLPDEMRLPIGDSVIREADGREMPDCYSYPASLRDELQTTLGQFPLFKYWGR